MFRFWWLPLQLLLLPLDLFGLENTTQPHSVVTTNINGSGQEVDFGKPFVWKDGDPKPIAIAVTYDNAGNGNRSDQGHIIPHSNNHVLKFEAIARKFQIPHVILGQQDTKWKGWGHRMRTYFDYFHNNTNGNGTYLTNDTFVVMFDGRDCIFQKPWNVVVETLIRAYHQVNQRIIVGTEIWCCTSKMNNHLYRLPGMAEGVGCGGYYVQFMRNQSRIAFEQRIQGKVGNFSESPFKYLNAGMIFGRVGELRELLEDVKPFLGGPFWDDQAKLTQLFYKNASRFYLDYDQQYFSNSDGTNVMWWMPGHGCFYHYNETLKSFVNNLTNSNPVLIHTSGRHWPCYNKIFNEFNKTIV